MNVSKRITFSTGIFGCFIIVLAIGCIVGGIVAMTEVSDDVSSVGLWAIYFLCSGIVLVIAGFGRFNLLMSAGVGLNTVGIFLSIAAIAYASGVWVSLDSCESEAEKCKCKAVYDDSDHRTYSNSCSDLETVKDVTLAVIILYAVLFLFSLFALLVGIYAVIIRTQNFTDEKESSKDGQPKDVISYTGQGFDFGDGTYSSVGLPGPLPNQGTQNVSANQSQQLWTTTDEPLYVRETRYMKNPAAAYEQNPIYDTGNTTSF
ncbi:uncharacterized protein LOC124450370 [Xenia sp. Carnegie-2017]|uniref:uncharacterized protein LOC124450370 n=1 Tax=Xenia sp. Carnegie-2017 TaxID=2897299 RepID=UPI001F03514B|nr:uncharacterized protein LOC124450370 [Xenia sp. Carnegie-2017]